LLGNHFPRKSKFEKTKIKRTLNMESSFSLRLLALGLIGTSVSASSDKIPTFETWALSQSFSTTTERAYRKSIYEKNMAYAAAHNAEFHSYTLGASPFAAMTPDEFKAMIASRVVRPKRTHSQSKLRAGRVYDNSTLPASVDWVAAGAVTPVKNQGQCGACWAFSTTGSVEGISFITTGILPSLSEQELIDCTSDNQGCNGGFLESAFAWIVKNGGISNETAYPSGGGSCRAKGLPIAAKISGYTDVTPNNELALETALAKQPVSVLVEADQSVFQMYTGGVLDAPCGSNVDLAVLAVGYGEDAGKQFYKLKLSWGSAFGEKGFMRIGRGAKFNPHGQCGVQVAGVVPNA
jgi:KDEL-tailed cysteine endopeptidase